MAARCARRQFLGDAGAERAGELRQIVEAGMKLAKKPVRPRWTKAAQILLSSSTTYQEWEPFLRTG